MKAPEAIGHLDADSFYCSAEQARFEHLRGLPLAVLGNQGACVIARSRPMKATGVGVGEPIWEARAKCPDGAYLKRDFEWYAILSARMLALVADLSGRAEYYSIDEFFFDATPPRGLSFEQYAAKIRDRIMEDVGVPVTVGIARSRTIAKLISDSAKPFGVRAVLDPAAEEELLRDRPVTEITGIAGRRALRLGYHDIRTCLDLARADRRLVRSELTAEGEALWWELRGDPVRPIRTERPLRKFISRGGSFGEATDRPLVLWAWLIRNLERLIEELRFYEICAGRVRLLVYYRDGRFREGWSRLEAPTDRFDALLEALAPCLRAAWIPRAVANRMHVFAENLVRRSEVQLGLFVRPGRDVLSDLKQLVNGRHGRFRLRSAATLPLVGVYRDKASSMDICDVRGKFCF